MKPFFTIALIFLVFHSATVRSDNELAVSALSAAPSIDGDASDWGNEWVSVHVKPAKEDDNKNRTGELDVQIQAGVNGQEFYLIARWPDEQADIIYRPLIWKKNKYKPSKKRDDMFAVRFEMGGDFNSCMIADANYEVDTWLWSAARSNEKNYATDGHHLITLKMTENAAEYTTPSGKTVYIYKWSDEGKPGFKNAKRSKKKTEDSLPGVTFLGEPEGSIADVSAKGVWKDGFWTLEFKRKLNTGYKDDVVLPEKGAIRGQVAVFNKGFAEHKSFSEFINFKF